MVRGLLVHVRVIDHGMPTPVTRAVKVMHAHCADIGLQEVAVLHQVNDPEPALADASHRASTPLGIPWALPPSALPNCMFALPVYLSVFAAVVQLRCCFNFYRHVCLVFDLLGPHLTQAFTIEPGPIPGLCRPPQLPRLPLSSASPSGTFSATPSSTATGVPTPSTALPFDATPGSSRPALFGRCAPPLVRKIAFQLMTSLAYLERRGILHADLKPQNVMLELEPDDNARSSAAPIPLGLHARGGGRCSVGGFSAAAGPHTPASPAIPTSGAQRKLVDETQEGSLLVRPDRWPWGDPQWSRVARRSLPRVRLRIVDLGNAFPRQHCSLYYTEYELQTPGYRAPEVLLGCPFDAAIDVWSAGVILAELVAGRTLFPWTSRDESLTAIESLLGPFPARMLREGLFGRAYASQRAQRVNAAQPAFVSPSTLQQQWSRERHESGNGRMAQVTEAVEGIFDTPAPWSQAATQARLQAVLECDDVVLVSFLAGCLAVDPGLRFSPKQALSHPYLRALCPLAALLAESPAAPKEMTPSTVENNTVSFSGLKKEKTAQSTDDGKRHPKSHPSATGACTRTKRKDAETPSGRCSVPRESVTETASPSEPRPLNRRKHSRRKAARVAQRRASWILDNDDDDDNGDNDDDCAIVGRLELPAAMMSRQQRSSPPAPHPSRPSHDVGIQDCNDLESDRETNGSVASERPRKKRRVDKPPSPKPRPPGSSLLSLSSPLQRTPLRLPVRESPEKRRPVLQQQQRRRGSLASLTAQGCAKQQ